MIIDSPIISGSLASTGSLTQIGNVVITGSLNVSGPIKGNITGSADSASFATTSSYAFNAELLDGLDSTSFVYTSSYNVDSSSFSTRVTNTEATASSLVTASGSFSTRVTTLENASSSFAQQSGSNSTRLTNLEITASVLTTASASFAVVSSSFASASGSLSTRTTNLESTSSVLTTASASFAIVSQSFSSTSQSLSTRVTTIEGSYATTGSNLFSGTQGINSIANAISFTSTASLYTDGGARITKDLYVSGTSYFNNVTIYGTQSVNYITSSQLNIGTNIITVNTDTPTVRYGGIAVYDSGSTGLTGSLLWDSEANHWIYTNPSGSTYSGGMMISGPRASARGCEQGTTSCALMMGQGGDHITSSAIFHYGNATCFYGQSFISSSGNACFSGQVCSNTVSTTDGTNTSTLANNFLRYNGGDFYVDACAVGGNFRIRTSNASALDSTALFVCGGNSRVGIGTTTPYANLHVTGTIKVATGNAQGILGLGEANGTTVNVGLWRGAANAPTTDGNFLNLGGYEGIIFAVGSAAIGSQTERMRITSGGDVGIGVSSPIYGKLHVGAATTDTVNYYGSSRVLIQQTCNLANNFANLSFVSQGGSDSAAIWSQIIAHGNGATCGTLSFGTSNSSGAATERMRITSAGCVSIGTTCTLGRLTVASEAGTSGITLLNTTAAVLGTETQFITWEGLTNGGSLQGCPLGRIGVVNVNGGTSIGSMVFYTKQYNAGICERMRITSDGCVGFGAIDPTGTIHICGADLAMRIQSTSCGNLQIGQWVAAENRLQSSGRDLTLHQTDTCSVRILTNGGNRLSIFGDGIACFACQVCVGGDVILSKTTTISAATGGPVLTLGDTTSEVGMAGGISFAEDVDGNPTRVTMGMYYDGLLNRMHFVGACDGSGGVGSSMICAPKHMTILRDSTAVGIGNTGPTTYGAGYANLWVGDTGKIGYISAYNGTVTIEINADGAGNVRTRSNHNLVLGTNETARVTITNTGIACFACQVCVPRLQVFNTSSIIVVEGTATNGEGTVTIAGKNSSGTSRSAIFKYDNADIIRVATADAIPMRFETSDVTRFCILANGTAYFTCDLTAKSLGTNDLILNNLNYECANYVDGTRGSWLIQEGACDLFIINQVSCKKYKFNLIEIK